MMKRVFLIFVLLSFILAACQQVTVSQTSTQQQTIGTGSGKDPGSSSGTVKEFKISITHAAGYTPNTFTVKKGDTVRFLATSDPLFHEHGITISEYDISVKVTAGEKDPPQVIEFVADKPGEFLIWCGTCLTGPIGDHPWLRGKLIVKP